MTTIHYKPFENSPHKCHPLSAVSTPRTQGIFKKPNLRLSEILLNSYLFAAGSFLCNPIVMHWSWNQSPAVHATSVRFQTVAEHNNSIDSWINQRGKTLRRKIHHAPWSSRGTRESWASGSGAAMSLESHSRGWKPDLNIVCLEIIDESIGKRKKHLNYEHFSWGESSVLLTALKCSGSVSIQNHGELLGLSSKAPYISHREANKGFVCTPLWPRICPVR